MNANFKVIGLTRLGIKPKSTAPEANALTTRPSELLENKPASSLIVGEYILEKPGSTFRKNAQWDSPILRRHTGGQQLAEDENLRCLRLNIATAFYFRSSAAMVLTVNLRIGVLPTCSTLCKHTSIRKNERVKIASILQHKEIKQL